MLYLRFQLLIMVCEILEVWFHLNSCKSVRLIVCSVWKSDTMHEVQGRVFSYVH